MPEENRDSSISLDHLVPGLSLQEVRRIVERALAEDLGTGDVTTGLTVPEESRARGTFFSKQPLVVAGLPVAAEVFRMLEPDYRWDPIVSDGTSVNAGQPLARVEGKAATLLSGERVALNFLQRLSGIATLTREFKNQLEGQKAELLDTRKTTPGLRILEKYAVRMGGGTNHRMGLDDGILIKNNHLALGGGIRAAVEKALQQRTSRNSAEVKVRTRQELEEALETRADVVRLDTMEPSELNEVLGTMGGRVRAAVEQPLHERPSGMMVEVEVRSREELDEAITAGADIVLLDNMTPDDVAECVKFAQGRVLLEVSGGVNLENIRAYAESGVDRISVGALTHSAPAADINFLIEPF